MFEKVIFLIISNMIIDFDKQLLPEISIVLTSQNVNNLNMSNKSEWCDFQSRCRSDQNAANPWFLEFSGHFFCRLHYINSIFSNPWTSFVGVDARVYHQSTNWMFYSGNKFSYPQRYIHTQPLHHAFVFWSIPSTAWWFKYFVPKLSENSGRSDSCAMPSECIILKC